VTLRYQNYDTPQKYCLPPHLPIDFIGNLVTAQVANFQRKKDYLSLSDIAKYKNPYEPKDVVKNWMRSKNTIEFLGLWEVLNNPGFKVVEFDHFKNEAGYNSFTLFPKKWIELQRSS